MIIRAVVMLQRESGGMGERLSPCAIFVKSTRLEYATGSSMITYWPAIKLQTVAVLTMVSMLGNRKGQKALLLDRILSARHLFMNKEDVSKNHWHVLSAFKLGFRARVRSDVVHSTL